MEKTDIELVLEAYGWLPSEGAIKRQQGARGFGKLTEAKDMILDILLRPRIENSMRQSIIAMVQAELNARGTCDDLVSPLLEKERMIKPAALEEIIALIEPPQEMGAEIREAFQKWAADLTSGALKHIDALIERDKGTELEGRWRELRERSCGEMNK